MLLHHLLPDPQADQGNEADCLNAQDDAGLGTAGETEEDVYFTRLSYTYPFSPPLLPTSCLISRFQALSALQQHKLYAHTADQHKDVHTWVGTAPQSPKIIGASQYHFHTPDFALCKLWLKTPLTAALTRRPVK